MQTKHKGGAWIRDQGLRVRGSKNYWQYNLSFLNYFFFFLELQITQEHNVIIKISGIKVQLFSCHTEHGLPFRYTYREIRCRLSKHETNVKETFSNKQK